MAVSFEGILIGTIYEGSVVKHVLIGGGWLRRFEVAIPGLPVFRVEFGAMESAAATQTGWKAAFLAKVEREVFSILEGL